MWIFIFTSFMLFAAFTSGFIVYAAAKGMALNVILPHAFIYSTIVIVLSSITMFLASSGQSSLQFANSSLFLWLTIVLGIAFFAFQVYGWYVLTYKMGVYFIEPKCIAIIYLCIYRHAFAAHY